MATVATISVNFAQYDSVSFTPAGVIDRSINPRTLSQYCLGTASGDLSYLGGFVKKNGDNMSGYLTLPSANPISDDHATRKGYVDSRIFSLSSTVNNSGDGGFVKIGGSTMIGDLILNTSSPLLALQASSKGYVDSRILSLSSSTDSKLSDEFLALKGGTMQGVINMNGHKIIGVPVTATFNDSDLVTKKYVDSSISNATAGGASEAFVNQQSALKVNKAGDTMTGFLNLHANPTANTHAANKAYVDAAIISGTSGGASTVYVDQLNALKVNKAGDTMTGFLNLHANPTANTHAANKAYVDSSVSVVNTSAGTAINAANSAAAAASSANSNANNRVLKSGDTMTGSLAVQGNISATGDITAFSDIRTKKNINDIENALSKVLKLKGVTFERISDNKKSLGVIAQDVLNVIPEVVREEKDGYLSVAYGNIVGILIEAIRELNNKIELLENKNI